MSETFIVGSILISITMGFVTWYLYNISQTLTDINQNLESGTVGRSASAVTSTPTGGTETTEPEPEPEPQPQPGGETPPTSEDYEDDNNDGSSDDRGGGGGDINSEVI